MVLLHPIFLIVFVVMLVLFFREEDLSISNIKKVLIFCFILLLIGAGGRYYVGADFPVYKGMYEDGFPKYTTYLDVWNKATYQKNAMEIEWIYVLINKVFFDLGLPFYALTFFLASISLSIFYFMFMKYSYLHAASFLYYFMPIYFIAECGQMRQGLGGAFVLLSVHFIIQRKLMAYLITLFIALGFHKSSIIFLPAYWLVLLPFTAKTWLNFVIISVLLAPFQVYSFFGDFISSIAPQDVSNAYTGYSNDRYYGQEMTTGFADLINVFFIVVLLFFDKVGQKKVYYYEYFRNLAFFGYCLFYIFRGNEIFATRLPGSYFAMAGYFMVPALLVTVSVRYKSILRLVFFGFFLGFYVLFSIGNGKRGKFTWDTYRNVIWSPK